jgi:hypothetical protein
MIDPGYFYMLAWVGGPAAHEAFSAMDADEQRMAFNAAKVAHYERMCDIAHALSSPAHAMIAFTRAAQGDKASDELALEVMAQIAAGQSAQEATG